MNILVESIWVENPKIPGIQPTNAFHGNSLFPTSSSKKQIIVDEKKAVMEMWKEKMYEAVSLNLPL